MCDKLIIVHGPTSTHDFSLCERKILIVSTTETHRIPTTIAPETCTHCRPRSAATPLHRCCLRRGK
ncbi:hypothetical protein BDR07DRAFT_1409135 [Suillus spraguei]|nr:hypothetical protein BDR07DRAFT_1409135 [Suillus spraguei]